MIFRVVMPCITGTVRRAGGRHRPHLQGQRVNKKKGRSRRKSDFLLGLLFEPEDGGDIFLRNAELFPYFMVLHCEKLK
jgi:hypothetical protein